MILVYLFRKKVEKISIGSRIKDLREERGLSRPELAKLLNVTVGSISNYENDVSSPKEPILFKIIETFGCDANYLFQDVVKIASKKNDVTLVEYEHIKNFRNLDSKGKEHVLTVLQWETDRISALNTSKEQSKNLYALESPSKDTQQTTRTLNYYQRLASAGTGQIVFDDVPVDLIEIPDIPEYRRVKYAIGVNGDSMEPLYYDGDILLVEPVSDVRIGEVGIFIVDGESLVKKRGWKSLVSLNKKKHYPEIPLNEETRCLGRVVDRYKPSNAAFSVINPEIPVISDREKDPLNAKSGATKFSPDLSAITPDDLSALKEGAKLLQSKQKGRTGKNWSI